MVKRGCKICLNCNTEIGGKSKLCKSCGFHFESGEVRQDLLDAKNAPKVSAGKGKKTCPNCNAEIGARSKLCDSCAYHFESGEVRQDLLDIKQAPKTPKTYTSMGPGRKQCPECNVIISAVSKTCLKCDFDFVALKEKKLAEKELEPEKEEKVVKTEAIKPLTQEILSSIRGDVNPGETTTKLSSSEHAQRILDSGKERARNLLKAHKASNVWSHVDWKLVEEGLENTTV